MHHLRSRCRAFVLAALLACAAAAPARAGDGSTFTIGSGFGVSILMPEDGENVTMFSAPQSGTLIATGPGLRLGTVTADRGIEVGLDTSVWVISSNGSSAHTLVLGVDFEKHFPNGGATGPFIGVDGGFASMNLFEDTGAQGYLGGALGVRHVVGGDNGSMKVALRGRHFFETMDASPYNVLELAVAFDLWMPQ